MKAISLLQPWASLSVMGAKKIETRSRWISYRGPLLIQASKGQHYGTGRDKVSCRELCYHEPFLSLIGGGLGYDDLPFGAIIGKVDLVECFSFDAVRDKIENRETCIIGGHEVAFTDQELAFGDFSPGRYGYIFQKPLKFDKPIPAKGKQMIPWEYPDIERIIELDLNDPELNSPE